MSIPVTTLDLPALVRRYPGKGITFINGSRQEEFFSYSALLETALSVLGSLQRKGLRPGDELILQLSGQRDFLGVFWACLLGGIIPVPLTVGVTDDHRQKLLNVWSVLDNPFVVSSAEVFGKIAAYAEASGQAGLEVHMLERMIDGSDLDPTGPAGDPYVLAPEATAFIQFSSGSTGAPKGVVLTHRNLISNMTAIAAAARYSNGDSMLSWMPLTHDMGLIGFHLSPLFSGMDQYLMPTQLFIRNPGLWMDKATEHRTTILCSPNFGYDYLIRHVSTAGEHHWDLGHVRLIYNGAEPISATTCRTFLDLLAPYGLCGTAMCPVYGLAEASLAVTISRLEDEVIAMEVERESLSPGVTISPATAKGRGIELVNVGRVVDDCALRIVSADDRVVPEDVIGHIQLKGINVTAGYYRDGEACGKAFTQEGWLRTGDVGFLHQGALYVTGREKDLILVNGQNYYPHDIEHVLTRLSGVEPNKVVAAGYFDVAAGKEQIVVFLFHRGSAEAFRPLEKALRTLVNSEFGIVVDRVIPVKDIPRTTSGKLQRFRLVEQLRDGAFGKMESVRSEPAADVVPAGGGKGVEDPVEQGLLQIWRRVLQRGDIGTEDGFFEIGGNSLKAAEAARLIAGQFGVEMPLADLYSNATIKSVAAQIRGWREVTVEKIPAGVASAAYALSPLQRAVYYPWAVDPSSTAYNIPLVLRLEGVVDAGRLESGIRAIIGQQESLRMYLADPHAPFYSVAENVSFGLNVKECHETELDELLQAAAFDPCVAPLFRATLIRTGDCRHVLFLDFHHLIADGLSLHYFLAELWRCYAGGASSFPQVRYSDYVSWVAGKMTEERKAHHRAFWSSYLPAPLPVLDLPTDGRRPPVFSTRGRKMVFTVGESDDRQLRTMAAAKDCTLHLLLFTLYNVLLYKYTGQREIICGIPVSVREHPELEGSIGMFVNNLPVRTSIDPGESFITLLKRQKKNLLAVLEHRDYPFESIVTIAGGSRDVSRNPVFDTAFIYQNMGMPVPVGTEFDVVQQFFDPGISKFDCSMEVFDDGRSLQCAIEYPVSLFKESTIEALAGHFELLIRSVLDNPALAPDAISLLTPREWGEDVIRFNETSGSYPAVRCVHELFELQAARNPGAIALEFGPLQLTYAVLDQRAEALAALIRADLPANSIVAIRLPRSPELIIAILAVLKAGCAYVPIDISLPAERIGYLVGHSLCRLIIDERGLTLIEGRAPVSEEDEAADVDPPAYVIYTSGTTGKPKGVIVGHASLINYACWAASVYIGQEPAVFPLYTSVGFDLTVTSIFVPLITGNKMVIYEEEGNEFLLHRVIAEGKSTIVKVTPSHLKHLREMEPSVLAQSGVRVLIIGGEALETGLAAEIHERFEGRAALFNEYGPTEATVGCMLYRFCVADSAPSVPIGVPASNCRIYLLDAGGSPVARGMRGELYIAGVCLAKGYLYDPDQTERKFLPDPFVPGARMYRTGDTGKRLAGGLLEYTGRVDEQIKINGYRIEPQEIVAELIQYPGIRDALVLPEPGEKERKRLYAYYITDEGAAANPEAMREYLAMRLPHYMIPAHFIRIDSIPLTTNGKVDPRALPTPVKPQQVAGETYGNPMEPVFREIWGEVLGKADIGITDNFFDLGGDSVKAVQIVSRLSGEGIVVKVKDILTYQTIGQIVARAVAGVNGPGYTQDRVTGSRGLFPIESWFFAQHFFNPGFFNQSVLLFLRQSVDAGLLEKALRVLTTHHDGLRMNFSPGNRTIYYDPGDAAELVTLEVIDTAPGEVESVCQTMKAGFIPGEGILFRAALLRESKEQDWLFITCHHLLVDGISWRVLLEDLATVYRALTLGLEPRLPAKTASLNHWKEGLDRYARSLDNQEAYWQAIESLDFRLPQNAAVTEWRVRDSHKTLRVCDKVKTAFLLREANKPYNTDLLILLCTALGLTLREWTGREEVVVELENHGRHLEDIDVARTVGWFTAMYPVLLSLAGEIGETGRHIKAVKERLRSVPDNGMGYGLLRYGAGRGADRRKMGELRFNYLGVFDAELDNALFRYCPDHGAFESDPDNTLTTKLELNALVIGGELRLELIYNRKAHFDEAADQFMDRFLHHLDAVAIHAGNERDLHFTPSDFDGIDLDDEELNALFH